MSNTASDKNKSSDQYKDLTEEASRRTDTRSTIAGRSMEPDNVNEETGLGLVSSPNGDEWGENKLSTSIDHE